MKKLRIALFLLVVPVAGTAAMAQSSASSAPSDPAHPPSSRVAQARCQYTPNDPGCRPARQTPTPPVTCRQAAPCPSPCCGYGYPPPTRPPWSYGRNYGDHAAAGALIGLGIGAAAGAAKDGDSGTRFLSAMIVGGFGALIGAAIGHGIPASPWRHHRPAWDDPDENAMATRPSPPAGTLSRPEKPSPDRTSGP